MFVFQVDVNIEAIKNFLISARAIVITTPVASTKVNATRTASMKVYKVHLTITLLFAYYVSIKFEQMTAVLVAYHWTNRNGVGADYNEARTPDDSRYKR